MTTYIGKEAFEYCEFLMSLCLVGNNTIIEEGAFKGCNNMKDATFSGTIKSIGKLCFYNCTNLRYLYFNGPFEEIKTNALKTNSESLIIYYYDSHESYDNALIDPSNDFSRIRVEFGGHSHYSNNNEYHSDDSFHYYICSECKEPFGYELHDNNSEGACNICGLTKYGKLVANMANTQTLTKYHVNACFDNNVFVLERMGISTSEQVEYEFLKLLTLGKTYKIRLTIKADFDRDIIASFGYEHLFTGPENIIYITKEYQTFEFDFLYDGTFVDNSGTTRNISMSYYITLFLGSRTGMSGDLTPSNKFYIKEFKLYQVD